LPPTPHRHLTRLHLAIILVFAIFVVGAAGFWV
jgi:hypothetical protein